MIRVVAILITLQIFASTNLFAQNCPQNIGFENGNFQNWQAYTGYVSVGSSKNVITLNKSVATPDRHTIMSSATAKDKYGNFPVLAPNSSGYSVKLGNEGTGAQAEGLSYLIKVPNDQSEYTLSYQYAVVFQDPNHSAIEQPRFNAKVLDVAKGEYITCASFEYIATSNLPGFKTSTTGVSVLYKDWTTVTLNLSGYQGKELLLEFTTADCTVTGHFGYAYVDVNEDCAGIIRGNEICASATNIKLDGPSGYKEYNWFNADRSIFYGSGQNLTLSQILPNGSKVLLDLTPYDGFGCPNTVAAIITHKEVELKLLGDALICGTQSLDLTTSKIILNKSIDFTYTYFTDAALTISLINPTQVTVGGKYYIKATNAYGCFDVEEINVTVNDFDNSISYASNLKLCKGSTIDLTASLSLKNPAINVAYFLDKNLTTPITDPKSISAEGIYYMFFSYANCTITKQVTVSFYSDVKLLVKNPNPACLNAFIDLTTASYYLGSDLALSLSFYEDIDMKVPLLDPTHVVNSGKYYILATNKNGCIAKSSITLFFDNPKLVAIDPLPVCYPLTVDITNKQLYQGSTTNVAYTYTDANNNVISDPAHVNLTGSYNVTITNMYGCADTKKIEVLIYEIPFVKINNPKKTLEPYTVDITNPEVIKGSKNYEKIVYWEDKELTKKIIDPSKIARSGFYYISLINGFGCAETGMVEVIIGKKPLALVPSGFTPLRLTNNKLYPFFTSIKKLASFKIYNKWGILVFETKSMNPENGWNGYFKDKIQPFETYSWYIDAIDEIDEVYRNKGKTVLIQ